MTFDKRQTNVAKGIAIILMLCHHLFFNDPKSYDLFSSLCILSNGVPIDSFLADFAKVCVSIFLVLSGYGLYISYSKFIQANIIDGKFPIKNKLHL